MLFVLVTSILVASPGVGAANIEGVAAKSAPNVVVRCSTAELVIWLDTEGSGAVGSSYYDLEFTNLSGHTCVLEGFPGVSAVGLSGTQVGRAASRSGPGASVVISLAPGAMATAVLQIADAGNFPPAKCHEALAAGLRVYPPGATASKVVPYPFQACSGTAASDLFVRPMEKGTQQSQ
jgi:hypothetical protein